MTEFTGLWILKEMLRRYPPSEYPYLYGISGQILKGIETLGHHSPYAVKLIEEEMDGKTKQTFVTYGIPTKEEAIAVAYSLEDYPPMRDVFIIDQSDGRTAWQYTVNAPADRKKRYALCSAFYSYTGEPRYDIRGVYFSDSLEKVMEVGRRIIEHTGERNFLIVDRGEYEERPTRIIQRVVYSFSEVPPEEYEMWGNFYV
jgi:hypothetical protein